MNNYSSNQAHITFLEITFIFFLGLVIFTGGLFNHEFVEFESRFGVFLQEMYTNGITFFPTTYNKPYPDYPATQTILAYLFSLLLHKVNIFTAVLPTAIAATISLIFIYLTGKLHSRLLGIYGVVFALFTFNFLASARTISLDQFTCAATAASFYWVYAADLDHKKLYWSYILIAWILSFAVRGPIGLIIPASVVFGYYCVEKNVSGIIITSICAVVLLAVCMAGLIAAAHYQGGTALVHEVINMQMTHRMHAVNSVPFYYYFTSTFIYYALTFPVALIIYITYAKDYFKKESMPDIKLLKLLTIWVMIILVGMSIPTDEKMRYILPITPALSLSTAILFYREHSNRYLSYLKQGLFQLYTCLPFICLIIIICAIIFSRLHQLPLDVSYAMLFISLSLLAVSVIICRQKNLTYKHYELTLVLLGLLTFIVMYCAFIQPLIVQFNRTKPFVEQVEALRPPQDTLVFYKIGPDGEDIKYKVAADKAMQPKFIQTATDIINFNQPAIFIAKKNDFNQLNSDIKNQLKVFFIGHLGHQSCVVFARIKN